MRTSQNKQKGYLVLVIAIIITVVAFTSLVISYQFTNKALGITNSLRSLQAFYLAQSGLERAKYDITANGLGCTAINGTANYTNATFPNANGLFTVTGSSYQAATTLSAAMTAAATTMSLTSSSGFIPAVGNVTVDSEVINYTAVSGNTLTGLSRGAGGTIAAAHQAGDAVVQNTCVLISFGGVPDLNSSSVVRSFSNDLIGKSFSIGQSPTGAGNNQSSINGAGSGIYTTSIVSGITGGGTGVTIRQNTIVANPTVTTANPNFSGSNVVSVRDTIFQNSGQTQVLNAAGTLVASSNTGGQAADVSDLNTVVTAGVLWDKFFNQTKASVQASAQILTAITINGVTGAVIWVNGNLNLNLSQDVGSVTDPVILIVNGTLNISNASVIYGLVYAVGAVTTSSTATIHGALVSENTINLAGTTRVNYNPGVLALAAKLTSASITRYSFVSPFAVGDYP